jgi:CO dehydrogenase/acetyl-CoA synthase beta subunit
MDSSLLKVGNRVWDGVLLEENIGIELGSKENPVVKSILFVEESDAVHNNRITLIGQKIPFLRCSNHKFGFLILFSGNSLSDSDFRIIQRTVFLSNSIEDIFEKRYGRNSWFQISKNLMEKGINFSLFLQ